MRHKGLRELASQIYGMLELSVQAHASTLLDWPVGWSVRRDALNVALPGTWTHNLLLTKQVAYIWSPYANINVNINGCGDHRSLDQLP